MNDHNEALDRLRATNPIPTTELIDPYEISTVVAVCEERRFTPDVAPLRESRPAARPRALSSAYAFGAAFAAVVVIAGLFAVLSRNGGPSASESAPTTHATPTTTHVPTVPADSAETTTFEPYSEPPDANDVAVGPDGSIWVATSWAGVAQWLPGADKPIFHDVESGLPSDAVDHVAAAPDGTVWAGGRGWIARVDDDGVWIPVTVPDPIEALTAGPDGTAWMSREPNRLLKSTGTGYETISLDNLPTSGIDPWSMSLAVAPNGTLWAGTIDGRGIVSWDGTTTSSFDTAHGLPEASFTSVGVAPDGTVWAGFSNGLDEREPTGGIASFDGTQWTVYSTDEGLLTNSATVIVGTDGTVWADHYSPVDERSGVSRFDGNRWTVFRGVEGRSLGASVDAEGTLWMVSTADDGSVVGFDGTSTTVLDLPVFDTAVGSPVPPIDSWNPILSESQAKVLPAAATCPPDTDPDVPGPIDRDRPWPEEYSDQPADFDRVWGRILLVDGHRDTWTFDVCTNTWYAMNAEGALPSGGSLVYDVDSDRSILFGDRAIWVYDRDGNTWEIRSAPPSSSFGWGGPAAFYDPASGLVINAKGAGEDYGDGWQLSAYDVETDEWTTLGVTDRTKGQIVGYVHAADRLVTLDALSEHGMTLIDPRTGFVETVDQDHPEIVGGFGSVDLVNGGDTVYGWSWGGGKGLCRFLTDPFGWECLPWMPHQSDLDHHGYSPSNAGVYDWLNERLVMSGGGFGGWNDEPMTYFDDVWSMDPETGEWLELVPPSS